MVITMISIRRPKPGIQLSLPLIPILTRRAVLLHIAVAVAVADAVVAGAVEVVEVEISDYDE